MHWQQHLPIKGSTYFYSWEAIRENTTCTLLIGSLLNRQLLFQLERGQYQRSIVTVRTKKQKNTEKKNHCTNSYYVLLTWSKSFSVYLRVIESQIWKNTNKYLVQRHFEFKWFYRPKLSKLSNHLSFVKTWLLFSNKMRAGKTVQQHETHNKT